MELEETIERLEDIKTLLEIDNGTNLELTPRQQKLLAQNLDVVLNHLTKQEKRISDLEFALMDMVLQFADESKDSMNTMGLSALETAFNELDFDNPMPIKKVHEQYKKLAKQYFEKKAEK